MPWVRFTCPRKTFLKVQQAPTRGDATPALHHWHMQGLGIVTPLELPDDDGNTGIDASLRSLSLTSGVGGGGGGGGWGRWHTRTLHHRHCHFRGPYSLLM